MDVSQKAFLAGELAPALYARTDTEAYATGLRTCRNAVVIPGGGVSKRPGTAYVARLLGGPLTLTIVPDTLLLLLHGVDTLTAVVTDGSGAVVPGLTVTWESDAPGTASVVSTSPLTCDITGETIGVTAVRAHIASLGLTSNDCAVTVYDDYILHTFTTGSGFFVVTSGLATVRALLVAGGGSGGSVDGTGVGAGGGGGGGVLDLTFAVAVGSYPVGIGGGGPAQIADHSIGIGAVPGANGSDTTFNGHTAVGGGGGGGADATILRQGRAGGSGGGGASAGDVMPPAGAYNGGTGVPGQGSNGDNGSNSGSLPGGKGGGGAGKESDISGFPESYGAGGDGLLGPGVHPGAAGTGKGGEGGGQALNAQGTNGGSGILMIRYLASDRMVATGGTMTSFPV